MNLASRTGMRQTFDNIRINKSARGWSLQGERHDQNYNELDQVEPVAHIPWMADESARLCVIVDDKEIAESELLRYRNQVEKNIVKGNICAILLHLNAL